MMLITRMARAVVLIVFFAACANAQSADSDDALPADVSRNSELPLDEPCAQSLTVLLNSLKSENELARWDATECLSNAKDHRATEPLVEALLANRDDVKLRLLQWDALRSLDDPYTGDLLLQALMVPERRWIAAYSLGNLQITPGVEPLLGMLISGSAEDRRIAADVLGPMKDLRAIDPLAAALRNDDVVLRRYAATALGRIGSGRAVTALIAALNDPDDAVRAHSADSLGEIMSPVAVPALAQKLADPNEDHYVVMRAAEALGSIGGADAVSALIDGLSSIRRDAQWHSAKALASIEQPQAMQGLIGSLRRGNVYVVAAAYREFIRTGDDSFVPPLVEALNLYGDVFMARDYANSGNARLAEAAHSSKFAAEVDDPDAPQSGSVIWGIQK